MNATDRRSAAIAATVAQFLNEKHMLRQDFNRADIAAAIRDLKPLGRTDRWRDTISRWAATIEYRPNPMDWALLQGQVFALHAA